MADTTTFRGITGCVLACEAVSSHVTIATGVSQWNDLSGNGNHLVQATTDRQPEFTTDGGRNVVLFDGTDDVLQKATYAGGNLAQPGSVVIQFRQISAVINDYIFDSASNSGRWASRWLNGNFWQLISPAAATAIAAPTGATTRQRHCYIFDGASSSLQIDGGSPVTPSPTNPGTSDMIGLTLSGRYIPASMSNTAVEAIYVFDHAIDSDELATIDSWIAALDARLASPLRRPIKRSILLPISKGI